MARKDESPKNDAPPKVEDELQKILGQFMARHRLPAFMPPAPADAAQWWMDMQEQAKPNERPRQISVLGNDEKRRWDCPYHLRVCATLRRFLMLPEKDQKLVISAREDNIFWRGDEIYFFMLVIQENARMKKMGVQAYREESAQKARTIVKRIKNIRQSRITGEVEE